MNKTRINPNLLSRMVSYQLFDIERTEMSSMKELDIYGENTRSLLMYLSLHILQIDDKEANLAASHMGRCYGIIDIMKKMKYYLSKHRNYIPSEVMLKHGIYFERIWQPKNHGVVSEEFQDVVLDMAAWAKKHLEMARSFKLPKNANQALLLGVEAEIFLDDLEEYNFNLFDDHFTS